jgi:uncharacterized BrkB/YihY/UPF0761 family membrane protein
MSRLTHAVGQFVFPDKIREYVTFRVMTIFVIVLSLWNLVFGVLFREFGGALSISHRHQYDPLRSSLFLVVFNVLLGVGFWLIYALRERKELYLVRVVLYGMFLGAVAGEFLRFFFSHYLQYKY